MSIDDKPTFVATFNPQKERNARLAKRFYKQAVVSNEAGEFAVMLDTRALKTPGRRAVVSPSRALSQAVAAEWDAQREHIDPSTMPLTRIVTTAIDRVALDAEPAVAEIVSYAGTDLVCYRADEPAELVTLQEGAWTPLLEWFADATGARLGVTTGIVHVKQSADALIAVRSALSDLDAVRLTALHTLVTIAGSAVIGFAVMRGHLDAEAGFAASRIDEDFQIAKWGEDAEAQTRKAAHKAEFMAAARVFSLLS